MHNNRNNRETVIITQTIIVPTKSIIVASLEATSSILTESAAPLCRSMNRAEREKEVCASDARVGFFSNPRVPLL